MAIVASSIIADAREVINDPNGTRWNDAFMLSALNDGQLSIVTMKENSNVITSALALVAGTRQTIPADGIAFVSADRNTNGNAVTIVNKNDLDTFSPGWHASIQSATVENYCTAGKEDLKSFYVYPPSDGTGSLDVRYQAKPGNIAAVGSNITLSDEYRNALRDYITHRAFMIDTEVGNTQRANNYFNLFLQGIGRQINSNKSLSPNLNAPPVES